MSNKPISHKPLHAKSATIPTVIGWAIIVTYIIASIAFIVYYATTPSRLYKEGVKSYNEGDYHQAYLQFHNIIFDPIDLEYKNSLDYFNNSAYRYASELVQSTDESDLNTARHIFFGEGKKTNLVEMDYGNSRSLALKVVQVGDTVYFGEYDGKSLEWIVAGKEENGYLHLIAKRIVGNEQYDNPNDDKDKITWRNSSLRFWLNSSFYNQAFSSEQKFAIVYHYDNMNDCYDYINLPSDTDISIIYQYYRSIVSNDFWLYSYGDSIYKNVIEYKKVDTSSYFSTFGVKPAIWVDPSKITEVR